MIKEKFRLLSFLGKLGKEEQGSILIQIHRHNRGRRRDHRSGGSGVDGIGTTSD
jgi:hypothetical protein